MGFTDDAYKRLAGCEGEFRYCCAALPFCVLEGTSFAVRCHDQFVAALGSVAAYDWRLVREGEVLFAGEKEEPSVLAYKDMVVVTAYDRLVKQRVSR